MVDVTVVAALVPLIAKILEAAGKALGLHEIEFKVKDLEIKIRLKDMERVARADTFDIRDAVNELVSAGKAGFDQPGYKVKLKDPGEEAAKTATSVPSVSQPAGREPKS